MRINRVDTKAYLISKDGEAAALRYFKGKAKKVEKDIKTEVQTSLEYSYLPLAVLSAIKQDVDGMGTLIYGMENEFHVGLKDAAIYVNAKKDTQKKLKDFFIKPHEVTLEKIDLLLELSTLSPKALQALGYLE